MTILEAINKVKDSGAHKRQYRYDFPREKLYGAIYVQGMTLQPGSVLDVGCAYGTLSYVFKKAGKDVTALDVMPELHNQEFFDKEGIKFFRKNIETSKIEGKYDLILLTDVLEHLNYSPVPVMQKLYKACNKGIIITTPAREIDYVCEGKYADYISYKMIPKYKNYEFIDAHHHTYTLWELKELLKECGFVVEYSKLLPYEGTWLIKARKEAR